jgi:RsiW-degrading membrane proteinase PrsW (M82 family)
MEPTVCSWCEKPIEGPAQQMGNRPYCAECYTRAVRARRGVWRASLTAVLVQVAFVALVALLAGAIHPQLQGWRLVLAGVVLSLVPAVIWLALFYLQDVREPEPKGMVLEVFLLGALLARAVGMPLINDVFRTPSWLTATPLYHILGAILVVGFIQQFLIYAAVRFGVFQSAEFNERVDGVVYATAAALGYATMLNIQYVVDSGGLSLIPGVIRVTVTALALASFGGLGGYFLGRCKFESVPLWWMPAGLALAAVLDGLFTYVRGEISTTAIGLQGGGYSPWPGLVLGAVVAAVTFGILFYLVQRLEQRAPRATGA